MAFTVLVNVLSTLRNKQMIFVYPDARDATLQALDFISPVQVPEEEMASIQSTFSKNRTHVQFVCEQIARQISTFPPAVSAMNRAASGKSQYTCKQQAVSCDQIILKLVGKPKPAFSSLRAHCTDGALQLLSSQPPKYLLEIAELWASQWKTTDDHTWLSSEPCATLYSNGGSTNVAVKKRAKKLFEDASTGCKSAFAGIRKIMQTFDRIPDLTVFFNDPGAYQTSQHASRLPFAQHYFLTVMQRLGLKCTFSHIRPPGNMVLYPSVAWDSSTLSPLFLVVAVEVTLAPSSEEVRVT